MLSRLLWKELGVLLLAVLASCDNVYNFGGSIGATQPLVQFSYTINQPTSAIACIFGIQTAQFSNVLMVANTTPITLTIDRATLSKMYLQQSQQLKYMDVQSAIGNRFQLVNLFIPPNSNNVTVYFSFYNFDLPQVETLKTYSLSIRSYTTAGLACFACPAGSSLRTPLSCQCSPCASNFGGETCLYYLQPMTEDRQYRATFYSMANFYYRITNPPENIVISYKESYLTHKINLYVQYEAMPGTIAGQLNTYYSDLGLATSKLVTTSQNSFTFPTLGKNIILTLHSNENTPTTTVTIQYKDANPSSKLKLILGLTLGLGLAIIVTIVLCCLWRRYKRKRDMPQNSFYHHKKQLNFYFPEVTASMVFTLEDSVEESFEQLNASKEETTSRKLESERSCVVCLNPIEPTDKIRVTYCRHIFHSHCLMNWFKKTQNCPFCRHDCSIVPTQSAFDQFKGNKNPFRKKDLIAAIMQKPKPADSSNVQLLMKEQAIEQREQVQFEIEDDREYQPTEVVPVTSHKRRRKQHSKGSRGEPSSQAGNQEQLQPSPRTEQ